MKHFGKFALVMVLLAVAVIAVLCVTYPELQQTFKDFLANLWAGVCKLFEYIISPFREAFARA